MSRSDFREQCVERDNGQCLVPWCKSRVTDDPDGPGEIHHILERELWQNGGYVPENGASVCNDHHRMAEQNEIPPHSFWRWAGVENVPIPNSLNDVGMGAFTYPVEEKDGTRPIAFDKWGESFETPPHSSLREFHKYPSTRHLLPLYWQSSRGTAEERTERDDTGLTSVESFLDIPLVVTIKLDGSNAMLVADTDEPVRARNGRDANHESFDHLKNEYWDRNVYENLPDHLQVFGENMYAKHSIHYTSDGPCEGTALPCECSERNNGPVVDDVFLVFGVYDTRYDLWLSWPETEQVAEQIGFPTVPCIGMGNDGVMEYESVSFPYYTRGRFDGENDFVQHMTDMAEEVVSWGHEGIVVRSMYPFHFGQFGEKLAKFVRPNHVQTDEHWSHQQTVRNEIRGEN